MTKSDNEQAADGASDCGLLTKRELAKRLRISVRTCDSWMRTKNLPYIKIAGKTVRFRWDDVLSKLQSFRVN